MHDGTSVPVDHEVEVVPLVAWHVPPRLDQRLQQFLLFLLQQHTAHRLPCTPRCLSLAPRLATGPFSRFAEASAHFNAVWRTPGGYSHSMVPGGLEVTS